MTETDQKLAEFGRFVLMAMTEEEDWNADLLAAISDKAFEMGLAETFDDGDFKGIDT